MKKHLIWGFLSVMTAVLSACSTQSFEVNPNPISMDEPSYRGTHHFTFWGLHQIETLHPGDACGPEGVNKVETTGSAKNGFYTAITLGIYAPRDYAVYCNSQKQDQ